eukprot:scaffold4787_cov19-Tisochrysis_lutea.AAC.1
MIHKTVLTRNGNTGGTCEPGSTCRCGRPPPHSSTSAQVCTGTGESYGAGFVVESMCALQAVKYTRCALNSVHNMWQLWTDAAESITAKCMQ